ncbi:MAG: hypothetical protein AB1750_06185 [Chloroflexota bacterium]
MKKMVLVFAVFALFLTGCVGAIPPPTSTPTPTKPKPKPTATFTPTGAAIASLVAGPPTISATVPAPTSPTAPPALPSPFDIELTITNLTCGNGGQQTHPYTFTIDGTSLSLLQVDAGITTTGTYDPATGAFSTSGVVGPGTESYAGTIMFDGATITVTGTNSYEQTGQCTYTGTIEGTTTVP